MRRLFVAAMALLCLSAPAVASHRDHHHHSSKASVHVFGVADPRLNLARNWASVGSSAGGPHVGAVVVWAHHVGVIRGGPDASGQWLVESGNDGNAVRTRFRSLRGAIAFRYVGGGRTFASGEGRSVGATRNGFVRPGDNTAMFTDERRRRIRVAQNWMESGERSVHY
jgi:hypothetical protein